MMKCNTRFCPTLNGYLSLGHLYAIKVNQAEATRTGGKFIVRIDDTQAQWNAMFSAWQLADFRDTMRADLEWCGIYPDAWSTQSGLMEETIDRAEAVGYHLPEMDLESYVWPIVVGRQSAFYPGDERLTAEHVIMDAIEGVNLVIRGFDLITESCAYTILSKRLSIPQVQQAYIHRLIFDGDEVSKTKGNFRIKMFREQDFGPVCILQNLAQDCLLDPRGLWTLDNVRPRPVLGIWAKEMLNGVPA